MTTQTPWYRTGTVAVTAGSKSVAGTGSAWQSQVLAGDLFGLTDANGNLTTALAEVESVSSDTALTLKSQWPGSTLSGQKYAIIRNFTGSLPADLAARLSRLIAQYQISVDELTELLTSPGTVTLTTLTGETVSVQGMAGITTRLTAVEGAISGKEPTVTAGTAAQYYRGDKTWQSFAASVLGSVLTGLSTASSAAVVATDTVLAAFGKLQAQINARLTVAAADTVYTYPTVRPSLLLDFANSETVDPRISFSRASTKMRWNEKGVMEVVPINVPAIDYDPVTGQCKGLLIEESRTNLLTYSEQFDNAAWIKENSTIPVTNAATSPDGTLSADKYVAPATSGYSRISQDVAVTSGATYTYSIFVRGAEWPYVLLRTGLSGSLASVGFNLSTGVVTYSSAGFTPFIEWKGNGWYRVGFTVTAGSTAGNVSFRFQPTAVVDATMSTITGDGSSGGYLWGAQLEAGAFATSYIPTTSAAVTRAADVAQMTGANFASWYRQDEGTFVVEYSTPSVRASNTDRLFGLSDGAVNNRMFCYASGQASLTSTIVTAGAAQASLATSVAATFGTTNRTTLAYKANSFAAVSNGGSAVTDASGSVPVVDRMCVGAYETGNGTYVINGHIRRLAFYPKALSTAELQGITA